MLGAHGYNVNVGGVFERIREKIKESELPRDRLVIVVPPGSLRSEVVAKIGNQKFKGVEAQLFSELAKAVESRDWNRIMHEACRLQHLLLAYHQE